MVILGIIGTARPYMRLLQIEQESLSVSYVTHPKNVVTKKTESLQVTLGIPFGSNEFQIEYCE